MSERHSKLKFPIHKHMDAPDIAQVFPELFKHQEMKDWGFENQRVKIPKTEEAETQKYKEEWLPNPKRMQYRKNVFAYMIFLLDPLSDFQDEFERLDERKEAAAMEAGFKRNANEEWPPFVAEDLFRYKDDQFIDMCLKFIKIFKSDEWMEICLLQVELDRNNEIRWKGIRGKDEKQSGSELEKVQKLRDYNRDILAQLKILKENFVYGDMQLKDKVEEELITPENAMRIIG